MDKMIYYSLIIISLIIAVTFINKSITGNIIAPQQNEIVIPIKLHLINDESGQYTTFRNIRNIHELIKSSNEILSQANIKLDINEISSTFVTANAIPNALNGNFLELKNHKNHNNKKINIYLVQSLNNINGIALIQINAVLIADKTTVNDYRTLSHEIGHILGLLHVDNSDSLMALGTNGEILSQSEIEIIRGQALILANP